MNEITNHAELTVQKKIEGKYKKERFAMYGVYVLILVVFMLILYFMDLMLLALIVLPVYPFLLSKVIIPATFYLVDKEEKMDISGGTLTLSTILGKKKQKILVKMKVSSFDAIVPYNDEYKAQCDAFEYDKRFEAVSTMSNPEIYCAYGTNDYEERVICFFEVTNKAIRVMKFLNKNTVITEVSR